MKNGQWVRYTYGPHTKCAGKIGQVTHRHRGLTYVDFGHEGGFQYGCYEDFLESLTREERAVAIAKKAMGIKE